MDVWVIIHSAYSLAAPSFCILPMNIHTNLAMFVHFRDVEGCWWSMWYGTPFPAPLSYCSSVTAGPHYVMATYSDMFVGNKAATRSWWAFSHPLSSPFPWTKPLCPSVKITILLSFYGLLQLNHGGFICRFISWGVLDVLQDCIIWVRLF
jgi:hypothetical protein